MPRTDCYLNFMGNTEEAFNFYKSVFGREFSYLVRYKDTPEAERLSPADQEKLMHVSLPIGEHSTLMGTDTLESMGDKLIFGTNMSISVSVDSKEEADKIFNGLSQGAKVDMPIQDMFWGDYWGMLTDKFGVQWMVNFSNG